MSGLSLARIASPIRLPAVTYPEIPVNDPDQPRRADPPREGVVALVRQLIGGVVQLARLEIAHGRQEIGQMVAEVRTGAVLGGIAAAVFLLALLTLDLAIVLGLVALFEAVPDLVEVIIIVAAFAGLAVVLAIAGGGSLLTNPITWIGLLVVAAIFAVPAYVGFTAAWLTALFVLVLQLAIGGLLVYRAIQHFRIGPPEETIASVKEDIAWAKRLLRRG